MASIPLASASADVPRVYYRFYWRSLIIIIIYRCSFRSQGIRLTILHTEDPDDNSKQHPTGDLNLTFSCHFLLWLLHRRNQCILPCIICAIDNSEPCRFTINYVEDSFSDKFVTSCNSCSSLLSWIRGKCRGQPGILLLLRSCRLNCICY